MPFRQDMDASFLLLVCSIVVLLVNVDGAAAKQKKLLLVCFDGLRWDYVYRRPDLESFKYLARNGVKADFMIPPYPSQTSPSHITIATGLYPESHGVVLNSFYDKTKSDYPVDDYYTTMGKPEWFDTGYEPIWTTAASQGLKSGVYLYPASNFTVNGKRTTYSYHIEDSMDEDAWRNRIDKVVQWFRHDDFDFVALYFSQPDYHGHSFGPNSHVIADEVLPLLNRTIEHLLLKIEENNLKNELNVIFVSDHGMAQLDETPIPISHHVDESDIFFKFFYAATGLIEPRPGRKEKVYTDLKKANLPLQVFYKEEIPERFHYSNHERITSIVLIANAQKTLTWNSTDKIVYKGEHAGYDNMLPDMRSTLYMIGPSFKRNFTIPGFESIHIYELMCKLLNIHPAPNNGSLDVLKVTLVDDSDLPHIKMQNFFILFLVLTAAYYFIRMT